MYNEYVLLTRLLFIQRIQRADSYLDHQNASIFWLPFQLRQAIPVRGQSHFSWFSQSSAYLEFG